MARHNLAAQITALTFLLFLFLIPRVQSQDIGHWTQPDGVEHWRKTRDFFVKEIQTHLFSNLSSKELALAKQVRFQDRDDLRFGQVPRAIKEGDHRTIELSTAFVLQCQAIADASFIETHLGQVGFEAKYAKFCQDALDEFLRTGVAKPLEGAFEFAKFPAEVRQKWEQNREFQKSRQAFVMFGIAFIVAHELAHHINGDIDRPMPSRAAWIRAENRADEWAAGLLNSEGLSPYMGAVILDFQFGMIADKPPVPGATHPPIAERLLFLIEHVLKIDERQIEEESTAESVPFQPMKERWKREAQRIKQYLERNPPEERH